MKRYFCFFERLLCISVKYNQEKTFFVLWKFITQSLAIDKITFINDRTHWQPDRADIANFSLNAGFINHSANEDSQKTH